MKLVNVNLIARDIAVLCEFYRTLFGFQELMARRTAIYRCLNAGASELGFNAWGAYELLQLAGRAPAAAPAPVTAYCTFAAPDCAAVDALVRRCVELGGSTVRPAMVTHYNAYQAVLADPECNVFRVQSPAGAKETA